MTEPDIQLDPKVDPNATVNRFSGIHPDNSYPEVDGQPDLVQEMKLQARQESARTRRESSDEPRDDHPAFVSEGPDRHALGRWADQNNKLTPGTLPDGASFDAPTGDETPDVVA